MDIEKCANCNEVIGKLEKAYLYQGKVVCQKCDTRLRSQQTDEHLEIGKATANLNILFILISALGLTISVVLHFGSLLKILSPPPIMGRWLTTGFLISFVLWSLITNPTSNKFGKKAFNKSLWEHTPKGFGGIAGILIMYTLFSYGLVAIGKYASTSPVLTDIGLLKSFTRCYPSHYMALYALMLSLSYSFRCFIKSREKTMQ